MLINVYKQYYLIDLTDKGEYHLECVVCVDSPSVLFPS